MKFKKTFIIFLISLFLLNISLIYATNVNERNNNYLRIHVVANSDSIDDQLLKYTVAKKLNKYIANLTKDCKTKEQSKQTVEQNIQSILNICNETINENNLNYSVKAYLGKISYAEKHKDGIQMDAGIYDSLKIVIGNGNGENWWSLIYPSSLNNLEEHDIFSQETKYSFGIVELLKKLLP